MASDVLPVPTSPANQSPRPASTLSSARSTNARTGRSTNGSRSQIGLRSNDTPRKRFGTPVPMPRLTARPIIRSRHSHGSASVVVAQDPAAAVADAHRARRTASDSAGRAARIRYRAQHVSRPRAAIAVSRSRAMLTNLG